MEPKLTIELVPSTCWYSNVRSNVPSQIWDKLRKEVYANAKHRCEICFGIGRKWPVECHEVWHYDDSAKIQKLIRMIALCPSCHEVKHMGRAISTGGYDRAIKHFMRVNKLNEEETQLYIAKQFEIWKERSLHNWDLDILYLNRYLDNFSESW